MPPTRANGKVCYIEIPALDIERSAAFYGAVFAWNIRKRTDGSTSFDDGAGEVSGTWVTGRPPTGEPGLMVYIMVDSVEASMKAVEANGASSSSPSAATRARSPRASATRAATSSGSIRNRRRGDRNCRRRKMLAAVLAKAADAGLP
jgi:uncharacterized protein